MPGFTPRRASILAIGQNPVKEAWNMLAPTKTVSHSQYGLAHTARTTLARIISPAMRKTQRSIFIL